MSTDPVTPEPVLLRSDNDGVATLTLNRPAKFNALSEELLTSLQSELDRIAQDQTLKVVRAMCSASSVRLRSGRVT